VRIGNCVREFPEFYWVIAAFLDEERARLITISENGELTVCDQATGEHRFSRSIPLGHITGMCVSPDEQRAITVSKLGHETVRIWEMNGWESLHTADAGQIEKLLITPDGRRAILHGLSTVTVWDVELNRSVMHFEGSFLTHLSLTPDGRLLVAASVTSGSVHVWNIDTGEQVFLIHEPDRRAQRAIVGPDGRWIASVWDDGSLQLSDLTGASRIPVHAGAMRTWDNAILTDDGLHIVSGGENTLWISSTTDGECVGILPHIADLSAIAIRGVRIVVGDRTGGVLLLEAKNFRAGPPIVTPVRLWYFRGASARVKLSRLLGWDRELTIRCPSCGRRTLCPKNVHDAIIQLNKGSDRNTPPCLRLHPEAWREPRLLGSCSHCQQPLRFNPFYVDNSV
jgi:WD40 repeat protein